MSLTQKHRQNINIKVVAIKVLKQDTLPAKHVVTALLYSE